MTMLTVKGQVTIPKPIRDRLGLKAGAEVRFEPAADGSVRILPARKRVSATRFAALRGRLRGTARTAALMRELRGYDEDAADPGLK
jgi:antitoxin PrlF